MIDPYSIPRVGIGVMIFKDGKILLGKRKGAHGEGEYAFPGGHLELNETFADCAKREVEEECGMEIANIRFQFLVNSFHYLPRHFVHVGVIADWASGEPQLLEPERCETWGWYAPEDTPRPLFAYCEMAIDQLKHPQTCIDADGVKL
jgi:8-oxo-dGTP diphosphatase